MAKKPKSFKDFQKSFEFGKTKKKKPNDFKPFIILIIISVLIASLIPYIKTGVQYSNTDIGLNTLEKNFSEGVYKEIVIDGNKAVATLS